MAAVAGLLSTSNADRTNDLVGEFQETIFVRNSKGLNVGSTLFGLMARLKTESADNLEFNWFERDPIRKTIYTNNGGGYTAGDTTVVFDDSLGNAVWQLLSAGHILRNDITGEYVRVTADPTSGNVTIARAYQTFTGGQGSSPSAAAAIVDNHPWTIVSLAKDEGSDPVRAAYEEPSLLTNFIQTFNSTVEVTNAFKGSVLRTNIDGPLTDRRIQALERISRDVEMAFLLGPKQRVAGAKGYIYTTGGIYSALLNAGLTGNIQNGKADNGSTNLKLSTFNTWMQSFMVYGSDAKLAFCGPTAYAAISTFANSATNGYRIMQNENIFGMHITVINTPFGEMSLAYHPLLKETALLNDWMFVVDLAHVVQKTFEPLFLEPNVQTPGNDSYKEQYRAKLGLKLRFANAFGVCYNLSGGIVP